jgi:putative acetyltransferase
MSIIYRAVQKTDNAILASLIRAVFIEHDAPRLHTVYSDPTTDDLFGLFQTEKSVLHVAEVDGVIAGCCGICPTEGLPQGYAELVKFYLSAEYRGKGIGKQLIEKCFDNAKQFGYSTIYIESFPNFAQAVHLYNKLGFKQIPNPLGNSGHTACTIWMIKEL